MPVTNREPFPLAASRQSLSPFVSFLFVPISTVRSCASTGTASSTATRALLAQDDDRRRGGAPEADAARVDRLCAHENGDEVVSRLLRQIDGVTRLSASSDRQPTH